MRLDAWFLTASERGNAATRIDRRDPDGRDGAAWTEGNLVSVLVDGREYFARLHDALRDTAPGDWVYLADLEGDADERLAGPGTEIGGVLAARAAAGVHVRGLLWRSHPGRYAEIDNLLLSKIVNDAGGRLLLDQRIRRGGSHHQKIVVLRGQRSAAADFAFVGGIDLAHGRNDDAAHDGDAQPGELDDARYGERPPWHDVQAMVRGPAVDDVAYTFRERWEDPRRLDSPNPVRALLRHWAGHATDPGPLARDRRPHPCGPHAVQVLRTYPARRRGYPFAPRGERSIARAYVKAFRRAGRLVYLEDQYLWSLDATRELERALHHRPELLLVAVIPRHPDPGGRLTGGASALGRERVITRLRRAGGGRVAVYDLENEQGTPVYVHSKVCIVDDVWVAIGSDNLNRRSWTHDSEISCAVVDDRTDERAPADPVGRGDGARVLARETRTRLASEHLAGAASEDDLVDPDAWFRALHDAAHRLDAWHANGGVGPRPRGHLRCHPTERVSRRWRPFLHAVHRVVLDPDGRPYRLRRRDRL